MMINEKKTFREAYGVLRGHAKTLRSQTDPNIDDLLSIVEDSVSAYKVCKERIDAVEKALQKALNDVSDADAPPQTAIENAPARNSPAQGAKGASALIAQALSVDSKYDDSDVPF